MAQKKSKVKRAKPRKRKKPLTSKQRSIIAKRAWRKRKAREKAELKEFRRKIREGKRKVIDYVPNLDLAHIKKVENSLSDVLKVTQSLSPSEFKETLIATINKYVESEMMEEDDETKIRARLIVAESEGRLDDEAQNCADEFDMDVREVYTLWISPK
jgi:hypothetical protein